MKKCRKSRSEHKLFTLIELLIVIAIISILASLLLPALKKAREKTYQIVCMNQQKNTWVAFSEYANDKDNDFPAAPETGSTEPYGSWIYILRDYLNYEWGTTYKPVSGPTILLCPSAKKESPYYNYPSLISSRLYYLLAYGYNGSFYISDAGSFIEKPAVKINKPSVMLLMADSQYATSTLTGENKCSVVWKNPNRSNCVSPTATYNFCYRHGLLLNILFLDGHVKGSQRRPDGIPRGCMLRFPGLYYE